MIKGVPEADTVDPIPDPDRVHDHLVNAVTNATVITIRSPDGRNRGTGNLAENIVTTDPDPVHRLINITMDIILRVAVGVEVVEHRITTLLEKTGGEDTADLHTPVPVPDQVLTDRGVGVDIVLVRIPGDPNIVSQSERVGGKNGLTRGTVE